MTSPPLASPKRIVLRHSPDNHESHDRRREKHGENPDPDLPPQDRTFRWPVWVSRPESYSGAGTPRHSGRAGEGPRQPPSRRCPPPAPPKRERNGMAPVMR